MLTDHLREDSAARSQRDAADTRHAAMKAALAQPISIPAGFTDPIEIIAKARRAMAADRARGEVVPFVRKAAPSPRPAPPPSVPLRPAARAAIAKLSLALDHKRRPTGLGDLLLAQLRIGDAR